MAIQLPDLDDKTYADLVEEARTALPAIYPAWTDHNPSDPGIALVELLAWLSEMIVYRTGRIPERSERGFLRLLSGGAHGAEPDLGAATEATLRDLRERYRAVTPEDHEHLVVAAWPASPEAAELEEASAGASRIARAHCVSERDLSAPAKLAIAPGHMSLVVMPGDASSPGNPWAAPPAALLGAVAKFFAERRLITTRFHAVGATPVPITLKATIGLRDDAPPGGASVRSAIQDALVTHFHPWRGGPAKRGWPFGRDVDVSDVYAVIDDVPGVEFVDTTPAAFQLAAPNDAKGTRNVLSGGKFLGLRLEAHELPRFDPAKMTLTLQERRGGTWVTIA
jgi:hypothetical protein